MTEEKKDKSLEMDERVYELGYLLKPSLDDEQLQEELNKIKKAIEKVAEEFVSEGGPDLIDLAYEMKVKEGGKNPKFSKAYFGWIKFVAYPDVIEKLKEAIDMDKNVMRYIIVKTVREDTRIQLEQEALKGLEEQKQKADDENQQNSQEEFSDEEIDKVVEELLAKIDDDIEDEPEITQDESSKK